MEFDPSFQSSFLALSNDSQLRDLTNPNLDDDVTISPLSPLDPNYNNNNDLSQETIIVPANNNNNATLLTTSISSDESTMLTKIAKDKHHKAVGDGVIIKGQWTPDEDSALKALVKEYGSKKWSEIAKHFKGRIGKQCRDRWFGHLHPNIRKGSWSKEEDMMLIKLHKEFGNKWAEIARRMEGRSDNSIKNHWNAIKRRRRMNSKNFRAKRFNTYDVSLLHGYIKEVTTSSSPSTTTSSKSKKSKSESKKSKSKKVVKNSSIKKKKEKGKAKMLLCASCGNDLGDDHNNNPPLLHNNFELPIYDFSNDSWVTDFYGGGGSCKGDACTN